MTDLQKDIQTEKVIFLGAPLLKTDLHTKLLFTDYVYWSMRFLGVNVKTLTVTFATVINTL